MASPATSYTFSNSTTADASQVNQNFTDIINGITDGTKDLSISALTCAGTATFNGNVTIGNATSDTLTVTAYLASSLIPSSDGAVDLGTAALGYRALYLGDGSGDTGKVVVATLSADRIFTIPETSADASFVMTKAAQNVEGVKTFYDGIVFDDAAGQTTCNYFREDSFTPVLEGSVANPTGVTYNAQIGRYTRIGNTCFVDIYLSWTTFTGGDGTLRIADLPFTTKNTTNYYWTFGIWADTLNFPGAQTQAMAIVGPNTTKISLQAGGDNVSPANIVFSDNASGATRQVIINGWYLVN